MYILNVNQGIDLNTLINLILAAITFLSTLTAFKALKLQERQAEINYMPNFSIKVEDMDLPPLESDPNNFRPKTYGDTKVYIKNNSEHQISEVFVHSLLYLDDEGLKNYILPMDKLNFMHSNEIAFLDNQTTLESFIPYNYHLAQIKRCADSSISIPEVLFMIEYKTKYNKEKKKQEAFVLLESGKLYGTISNTLNFRVRQIDTKEFKEKYNEIHKIQYPTSKFRYE
ncbi:hypothetical protein KYI09_06285 [Macrococcoides caseolyticum]|uniref:hypothetical protein n=1 Tax=Macrococcoides caseolyticum TaxID=69966 RepID=UPI001C5CE52D|nr:hypothetical protein [Macrococcus caseolyticus]QYA39228.1 hypothetical protein KYI09_06285 [Macrococcus caseolyticus]